MYKLKDKEESKIAKVLKDGRDDYMVVKLETGETRVVHCNLGANLVKKGVAKEVRVAIEESNKVREAEKRKKVAAKSSKAGL